MSLKTPVAFLIYKRPDTTEKVFEAIRQAQPSTLLIVADGPNSDHPDEVEKCELTRAILDRIDWDCNVLKNYSEINLGCKKRVSSGLDWVFSEVEEAIILEDDCLPSPSFFSFCETLLDYYRHDERIMMISGNNFQQGKWRSQYSYYFSKYSHIWGWASWRRAWRYYDVNLNSWPDLKQSQLLKTVCEDIYEEKYWTHVFDAVFQELIDTWDYQLTYAAWTQGGLSILPELNLVSNIGFGEGATHTSVDSHLANLPTYELPRISHPTFIIRNHAADTYTFDYLFGGKILKDADTLSGSFKRYMMRVKQKVKTIVQPKILA